LSAIVPLLLANRPGPRLPPLVVGRALLPLFLLVSFLLPKRVILFLPFLLLPFLLLPFLSLPFLSLASLSLASLSLASLAVLGVSSNSDYEKQGEYRRSADSDSLHVDTSITPSTS